MAKRAIITGASSGIGRDLASIMAADGWTLGLMARSEETLRALAVELGPATRFTVADVTETAILEGKLDALAEELGGVDCVVLSAGVSPYNRKIEWAKDRATIETNVVGFAACAGWAARYFYGRKAGHIVGLSSVASHRGSPIVPAYNASKAFVSHYLEGLRFNLGRFGIHVTDIRPGYVATPMTEGQEGMFWVSDVRTAARQCYAAIRRRKKVAYVTRRWALVALVARISPGFLYRRFSN